MICNRKIVWSTPRLYHAINGSSSTWYIVIADCRTTGFRALLQIPAAGQAVQGDGVPMLWREAMRRVLNKRLVRLSCRDSALLPIPWARSCRYRMHWFWCRHISSWGIYSARLLLVGMVVLLLMVFALIVMIISWKVLPIGGTPGAQS